MAKWVVYRKEDGTKHAVPYTTNANAEALLKAEGATAWAYPVEADTAEKAIDKAFGSAVCTTDPVLTDILNRFTYHAPKPGQNEKYESIRGMCRGSALEFVKLCPQSRELSLALTKLEESVFWANAAIARNE